MWPFQNLIQRYQAVQQSDKDTERDDVPSQTSWAIRKLTAIAVVTGVVSFILGMILQHTISRHSTEDSPHERWWAESFWPKTRWIKYQGGLLAESQYRGTPSKSIDEAWNRYTHSHWFDGGAVVLGVSEEDVRRSWKAADEEWFNSTVVLDEKNGGGYMATLEMFHQLHCLDMLRRYTYREYYPPETFHWGRRLREHLDHCVEMLRQVLMCHADTGLVLFHWTEGKPAAVPDFSTWHKCRDPEEVLQWAHEHEAPMTQHIVKPDGVIEMPSLD